MIRTSKTAKVEATVIINRLKIRAAKTMEPTSTVINECISGLSETAKVIIFCQFQNFNFIDNKKKMYLFIHLIYFILN